MPTAVRHPRALVSGCLSMPPPITCKRELWVASDRSAGSRFVAGAITINFGRAVGWAFPLVETLCAACFGNKNPCLDMSGASKELLDAEIGAPEGSRCSIPLATVASQGRTQGRCRAVAGKMGNTCIEHVMFLTKIVRRERDCPGAHLAACGPVLLLHCQPF